MVEDAATTANTTNTGARRHLLIVQEKALAVIENFSGYSLETLLSTLKQMKDIAKSDDTPVQWVSIIQDMLAKMLKDPDYVNEEYFRDDARMLFESAKEYY